MRCLLKMSTTVADEPSPCQIAEAWSNNAGCLFERNLRGRIYYEHIKHSVIYKEVAGNLLRVRVGCHGCRRR